MQIVLAVVSIIFIISTFLPLVRNDYWIFKILEYPRLQKLALIILISACWLYYIPVEYIVYKFILGGLFLSILYLFYKAWPYTILSKKEMLRVNSTDPKNELKLFAANVFQDNRQYNNLLKQVRSADPDIIFLLETNAGWAEATKELETDYPFTLKAPLENTYGLLLYSRLKMENANIKFIVKKDIPSIECIIILDSGEKVQLWGLHPEPPVPGENLYSTAKDKELMKIAFKAKECKLPAIVFGDLNDVAWSHTTELFRKTSEMLDPRRGRGFYNTFSAYNWFVRFPLDYIFCSKEFALISMKRMPKNGSDHFAMLIHVALRKDMAGSQDPPEADADELEEAHKLADQPVKE